MTVNGAVLVQRDISVHDQNGKGGLLHVLDRVMFPATIGDIVQTLESDPEQRFTTLIKALKSTGLNKEIQDYSSKNYRYNYLYEYKIIYKYFIFNSWRDLALR